MLQAFLTYIKDQKLVQPTDQVLLAVSGGADSMVMAELFIQAGYHVAVSHVNYQLRGADSQADEALVRQWCADNQIVFHLKRVDPLVYESGESIQMVARTERYQFFDALCAEYGYHHVATAHHANDNLETVLLNLTKGTGLRGLTGIAPKKARVIRPLLFATKEELYAYARERGIAWREDYTNQKSDYQRNLIRNEVVPLLRKINPNLEHTLMDTLTRLQGAEDLIVSRAQELSFRQEGEMQMLDVSWFMGAKADLVMLQEALRPFGFNWADIRDLGQSVLAHHTGALFHSSSYTLNLDRGQLLIHPNAGNKKGQPVKWIEKPGEFRMGTNRLVLAELPVEDFPGQSPANIAYVDRNLIEMPLKLRTWQQGDVFYPLGMRGKKKVSDFMIDSKIPVTLKGELLILESAGQIVWIVGHRLDDRYKITDRTTQLLKIELAAHV